MEYNTEQISNVLLPNETLQHIADEIGMENLIKIARLIGGRTFYFPQEEKLLMGLRNEKIKREFNGANYAKLSKKYGITEQWIRQICRFPPSEQLSLFDNSV